MFESAPGFIIRGGDGYQVETEEMGELSWGERVSREAK